MATPFKLKSGNASAFKNLGSSPVKEGNFNMTGSKASTTPTYTATDRMKKLASKIKTVSSHTNYKNKLIKGAGKVLSKAGKFLGGKTLGILGMLSATSSKADQPTADQGGKKSTGTQIKDLLTKHKLKGGR